MKIKRRSKYLLVGGAIIGALAIIAGSTAAVTIHSNNKLVEKSATTNSTKPNGSNPIKSTGTTKNSSANSTSPNSPDAGKTNSGGSANQNNPSNSSKNNNPNNSNNGAEQNGANKQKKNAKDAPENTQGNGGQSAGDQGKNSNSNPDKTPLNKDSGGGHETSGKTSTGSTKNNTTPGKTNSGGGVVPAPVPVPSPTDYNSLNYDLDINQNQANLSNVNTVNYLTNSFSLTNIKENGKSININNSSGTLTYTIVDLINNKILTTKTLVLSTSSSANWTNFSYNFAPAITTSSQLFSISVSLSISNATSKKPLIENTTYNFKIINPLQLSTSYSENGSLEQLFEKQMLSWVGNSSSTEWYDFINQWYFWYALNDVNASYFDDCKVYFSQMPTNDNLGTNEFLTIQAISTKPISVKWYTGNNNTSNVLDWGSIDNKITPIAVGSIFTWTLPYELAQLTYTNGELNLPMLNTQLWMNAWMRQSVDNRPTPSIPEPFGLSIGTLSNPTAISNDVQFNDLPGEINVAPMPTQNGIIGGLFGVSGYGTSWDAPSTFSYTYPLDSTQSFNNSSNETLNITSPELINFNNTATYSGQTVFSPTFSGTYTYSIINKTADIDYSNNGSLSGNNLTFNYYFDKLGEYEITITYILNNVLGNQTITNTQTYYVNYQTSTSTSSSD